MKPQKLSPSISPIPFSRRDFLAASAASVVLATFGRQAFANQKGVDAHSLSDASFETASQRAAELVNRMTLEEVTQQLVHRAPALALKRYNYWGIAGSSMGTLRGKLQRGPVACSDASGANDSCHAGRSPEVSEDGRLCQTLHLQRDRYRSRLCGCCTGPSELLGVLHARFRVVRD
jgi:hypothetical protein